jgi:hypothetical protein
MKGPHAERIRASLARWESEDDRSRRLAETDQAAAEVREVERADQILHDHDLSSSLEHEGVLL